MFTDPSARVPHVFVIPPEEEHSQNPPWCCFDADLPPENSRYIEVSSANQPDIVFDVPFLLHEPEPAPPFHHEQSSVSPVVAPQSRSSTSSSRSEKHQNQQHIVTSAVRNNDLVRIVQRDVREDSDVIEVVKVKRPKDNKFNHTDHVPPSPSNQEIHLKRSKTFRARASRAFQSIKNVSLPRGKQNNSKPHVKDLWTSTESMPGIFRGILHTKEDVSPTASRKLSSFLQRQPFSSDGILSSSTTTSLPYLKGSDTTPSIAEIRPSYEFIERPLTPCAPTYDHSLRRPVSSADFQRAPSSESKSSKGLKRLVSSQDLQRSEKDLRPVSSDDFRQDERPTSPNPPSTQSSRKRFSVNELHRFFSFSPEPPSSFTVPSTSTSASTSSTHSYPDVPYAAVHFVDDDYGREIEGKYGRNFDLLNGDDDQFPLPSPSRPRDISFELRLDSLHFDSLSFNAEDFDVSMNLETSGPGISRQ
ncbi:uncharacterized protein EDB93DRAFT_1148267 [Suillus bovinus]|uniref:uncharacterized protein n=1 Tax=Suillus bovinus TaxID=48563 RepID=UPI001B87594C|nr:uncharacterized protein EDB93DRAFT_1148267 [Suillus bovinus]KAG2146958.1 hypothetical protein EDB93DRAFT_1148267 [Suillus bovinus]